MNNLEERLRTLESDDRSGAIGLALQAVEIARDWLHADRNPADLAQRLRAMHPAIAAVANVGHALERGGDLAQLQQSLEDGNQQIAEKLARLIPPSRTIVTISKSSTVREALQRLRPRLVLALASEPGGEGADFATSLVEQGIPVRLEPDAAMGRLIAEEADLALVGADSFDSEGNLIHKTGTLPLALCCRRFGKPIYAAGHSIKRITGRLDAQPSDARFDLTPADLLTELITEE